MLRLLYAKRSVLQSYYGHITITLRKLFLTPTVVKLVIFTCGIEFYILTITQNVTILIVADIYKQQPTSGEFLNTHLKNSIL